jgi:hypothetical protein
MGETVSVEQDGVTVTSNTVSEAELRQELETPVPEPTAPAPPSRDPSGRFVKKAGEAEPAAEPPPAEPAVKRDETLPRHNPIARMNQALSQKVEAERRAAEAESRAAALEARLAQRPAGTPAPQGPPFGAPVAPATGSAPEPQFDQFANEADPYTAYLQAWSRWDRTQAIVQARADWDAQQQAQVRHQTIQGRLTEARTVYPDFDDKLAEADTLGLQVTPVMRAAMDDSPRTADLVYYLASHPEECTQLAEESLTTPVDAAPVMRRLLESMLGSSGREPAPRAVSPKGTGAAARVVTSSAKPPVTPVGSSPVMSDEPPGDTASAAEHARYWNRRLKVPGTR